MRKTLLLTLITVTMYSALLAHATTYFDTRVLFASASTPTQDLVAVNPQGAFDYIRVGTLSQSISATDLYVTFSVPASNSCARLNGFGNGSFPVNFFLQPFVDASLQTPLTGNSVDIRFGIRALPDGTCVTKFDNIALPLGSYIVLAFGLLPQFSDRLNPWPLTVTASGTWEPVPPFCSGGMGINNCVVYSGTPYILITDVNPFPEPPANGTTYLDTRSLFVATSTPAQDLNLVNPTDGGVTQDSSIRLGTISADIPGQSDYYLTFSAPFPNACATIVNNLQPSGTSFFNIAYFTSDGENFLGHDDVIDNDIKTLSDGTCAAHFRAINARNAGTLSVLQVRHFDGGYLIPSFPLVMTPGGTWTGPLSPYCGLHCRHYNGTLYAQLSDNPFAAPSIASGTLAQYKSDGVTPIAEGGSAAGNAVVFTGILQSAFADSLVLQVEVEPAGTPFVNIGTASSAVSSGQTSSLTVTGLSPGQYHWQARAIDLTTLVASPWQEFGTPGNVDFVLTAFPPQVLIIPGILGTKLSATANVPWLTNSQLTSGFADDAAGDTQGIIQLFSQLEYGDDGTPTTSLHPADLFNYIESPLPGNELSCQSLPLFLQVLFTDCGPDLNTYNSLRDYLFANGFAPQSFAYDWRMDLTALSTQLYDTISHIMQQNPGAQVFVIAHSMGGLIVGKMLARIASGELAPLQAQLGPVITLGTPFDGAVDAYLKLRGWQGLLPWIINGQASVAIGKNWTSAYELLPRSDFVSVDLVSLPFASVYNGTSFASDLFPALPRQNALSIADSFWNTSSVGQPSVFRIVGTGQQTAQTIVGHENTVINSASTPALCKLQVVRGDGDGTVPIGSATNQRFLPTANTFYVQDTHIHLPSNPSVLSAIGSVLTGRAVPLPTIPTGIQPEWHVLACSPVTVQVTDAAANVTNLRTQQIPDSAAFSLGEATQVSVPGIGQFQVALIGTAVGSFDLIFNKTDSTGQILQQSVFLIVPVLNGSQAHVTLDESGPGLLTLDLQGNGVNEFSISPGEQPNTVTSLLVLNAVVQSLSLPPGIEVSLTTKLKNAIADLDHGDNQSALGILNAFTNELSAQSSKALSSADAASVIRIVNRLMNGILN